MLELKPTDFYSVQHWFVDFQKKSKGYEIPPEDAVILGIFDDAKLVGYYVLVEYKEEKVLEVNQGYLSKEARHQNLSPLCMSLLEDRAKELGYKKIMLQAQRSIQSYIKFMDRMGYRADRVIFSKEI